MNRVVEGYSTFRRCGIDVLVADGARIAKRTRAKSPMDADPDAETLA